MKKRSSYVSFLLRFGISFLAIGLILFFLRGKLNESLHILKNDVIWKWFAAASACYMTAFLLLGFRLQILLRVHEILLKFWEVVYLNLVGTFFNLFFPSAVGGDIAKAYFASKKSGNKLGAITSIMMDRLMGFVALILMALIAVLVFSKEMADPRVDRVIYATLALMLLTITFCCSKRFARLFKGLLVLIPSDKWKARAVELYHAIYFFRNHLSVLISCVGISFVGQVLFVSVQYFVAVSLGVEMNAWLFFIIVPMVSIASMAPSLGGLGVREAGSIFLFSRFMEPERALVLSLLVDFIYYGLSFLGGIVFSLKGGLKMDDAIKEMKGVA